MVNFNDVGTVGVPAVDIEKINILHKRENVILAIEHCKSKRYQHIEHTTAFIQATFNALFNQLQATLKRHLKEEIYNDLKDLSDKADLKKIEEGFYIISELLDKLKITKVDNLTTYEGSRVIIANRAKYNQNANL
jgi:hypothetical protein